MFGVFVRRCLLWLAILIAASFPRLARAAAVQRSNFRGPLVQAAQALA